MPTDDYACGDCGGFDAFRSLAERNEPATCPESKLASPRVLTRAPGLALMDGGTRTAMATNERARHGPMRSGDYARLKHPAGCGCRATLTGANGAKASPSKRPWMISH